MSSSLKFMHIRAQEALKRAQEAAGLKPVVTQTLGNAPDSNGFHAKDGTYTSASGAQVDYCAAVDFSVVQKALRLRDNTKIAMDEIHIKWWLQKLAENGFVAWYRYQAAFDTPHIHAVYVGCKMKPQLRSQVKDFLADRTGLAGHAHEEFWTASAGIDAQLKALFEANNF